MSEELMINESAFYGNKENYDAIMEAIEKLSTTSQEQFETMKKERWYNRVFDMVTFSQKGKKRLAEQISTVSQAQQIFIELLLRLSSTDTHISQIVCESIEDIRRIQGQNIYLLERIKHLEDISLGIKADMDINRLSEKEKQVLCGCLYMISERNNDASDAQKKYANAVISYLDINAYMENPTMAIDGMDNESKRRILRCCMEYMFLRDCTEHSFDGYDDFIDEFDFGNKTIKGIEKQIFSLYSLRGYDGFYLKYGPENFEDLDEFFSLDLDDESNQEEDDLSEMVDETISSILQIHSDAIKSYKNKNIHIAAYVNCEGTLEIDHCVVYYNETEAGDEITLANGANLSITNSIVICRGFDKNHFISCSGNNKVLFENTTFIDCSYLIKSGNPINFTMTRCELRNCYDEFVRIWGGENSLCDISSNVILQDNLCQFHINNLEEMWGPSLISISCYGHNMSIKFYDNTISEHDTFRKAGVAEGYSNNQITYLDCDGAEVVNCSFIGISSAIAAAKVRECKFENCTEAIYTAVLFGYDSDNPLIDNCVFENCTNVITTVDNTQITNCQFISCYDMIIKPRTFNGGVHVEFCQFVNTKNRVEDNYFSRIWGDFACLTFRRAKDSKTRANYLRKCIFDGVEMGDNFLIAAKASEKPSGVVTYIEECDFKNCSTKRTSGKIIKEYIQYDTLFKKNMDFHANMTANCRGLDKINKEGIEADNVEVRTTATTGNAIGASSAANAVGAALAEIVGPIGLWGADEGSDINDINKNK